ncbi:MAG: DUF4397 domain-containing protein [Myxococcota bacterium]
MILALSACGDDDDTTVPDGSVDGMVTPDGSPDGSPDGDATVGNMGQIRLWHLAAGAGSVDVFVNGNATLMGLEFEQNTAYIALPAGSYDFAVAPAGSPIDDAVITVDGFNLTAGTSWTIIATQLNADATAADAFGALPIEEDTAAPDAGNVKVRVFHAAYAVPSAVDVHNLGDILAPELLEGLAQGTAAPMAAQLATGALTVGLDVGPMADMLGTTDGIVDLRSETIDAPPDGSLITMGVISKPGDMAGEDETEVVFLVGDGQNIHDEVELEAAANARIWHLAPEAGNVDIYLGGQLALSDVPFEGNTPYLPFGEGAVDVAVVPTGGAIGDAVINVAGFMLTGGEYYTLVAWQQDADETAANAFQVLPITEDRVAPMAGNIKVRVFHVSYLVPNAVDVYNVAMPGTAAIPGLAQGAVSDTALDIPNGAYTFGIDINSPADGTIDLQMAMPLDMPPVGSFVTLGVLTKPDGADNETEVVFLVNNGLHDEIELE